MKYHSTYKGVNIYRNMQAGYALRWSASGGLAADTLAGIKQLISERVNHAK